MNGKQARPASSDLQFRECCKCSLSMWPGSISGKLLVQGTLEINQVNFGIVTALHEIKFSIKGK